eukprot:3549246-Rhodomonas_salina.1
MRMGMMDLWGVAAFHFENLPVTPKEEELPWRSAHTGVQSNFVSGRKSEFSQTSFPGGQVGNCAAVRAENREDPGYKKRKLCTFDGSASPGARSVAAVVFYVITHGTLTAATCQLDTRNLG